MAQYPTTGESPWGDKLKAYVDEARTQSVDAANRAEAAAEDASEIAGLPGTDAAFAYEMERPGSLTGQALDAMVQILLEAGVPPLVAAAIAADPTILQAAEDALTQAIAGQSLSTAETFDSDLGIQWASFYKGNRETAFALYKDGSTWPTLAVTSAFNAFRVEMDPSTGLRWGIFYAGNRELAFGQFTDGSYYPSSLGGGSSSTGTVLYGDSMVGNWAPYVADLATLLGKPVFGRGIGGQTSYEIAARQGGQPARIVSAVTIPASGSVNLTLSCRLRSDTTVNVDVVIAGVSGTFRSTGPTTGSLDLQYTEGVFTRNATGLPAVCPAGTPVGAGYADRSLWPIFWYGRNNWKRTTPKDTWEQIVSDIRASMEWTQRRDRALVLAISPWSGEENGTGIRDTLNTANANIRDAFPAEFLDIPALLRNADVVQTFAGTVTATDTQNIADGITPISFRTDAGHYSAAGYAAVNAFIKQAYVSKGWI